MPASTGREKAAAAEPKLPHPPYTPSAVPTSRGGNHSDTIRMPTTKPAPTTDSASRLNTSASNVVAKANTVLGTTANSRMAEYTRLGPQRSRAMPMKTRAGTVSATLQRPIVFFCASVRASCSAMVLANGAKLNQTTKLRKKANHVRWRMRYLPWKDSRSRMREAASPPRVGGWGGVMPASSTRRFSPGFPGRDGDGTLLARRSPGRGERTHTAGRTGERSPSPTGP